MNAESNRTQQGTSTPSTTSSSSSLPLSKLRVQILAAKGLAAKDRNGKSDPFVVVNIPGAPISLHSSDKDDRKQTTVKSKTLDPVWKEIEATFDFDILPEWFSPYLSTLTSDGLNAEAIHSVLAEAAANGNQVQLLSTSPGKRPRLTFRSSSKRVLTGAAGAATKVLVAPVKLGAAGAKAVGKGVPRPMRLRRKAALTPGRSGSAPAMGAGAIMTAAKLINNEPRGSIQLDATNALVNSLEFVLWDKDKFSGNDYLGECSLGVREWCQQGQVEWSKTKPLWLPIVSSRPEAKTSGELQVKVGFVPISSKSASLKPPSAAGTSTVPSGASTPAEPYTWSVDEIYERLTLSALGSESSAVRAIPASQSVGTAGPTEIFVDDGLSSDSDLEDEDDDDASTESDLSATEDDDDDDEDIDASSGTEDEAMYDEHYQSIAGIPGIPPTGTATPPASVSQPGRYRRIFRLRKGSTTTSRATTPSLAGSTSLTMPSAVEGSLQGSGASTPLHISGGGRRRIKGVKSVGRRKKRQQQADSTLPKKCDSPRQRRANRRQRQEFAFKAEMGLDIIGIVMMEVKKASDLPRWKNMTHTSFDMDPFTIVSFGQKIFRTRVARHTLNPVWEEKLLFHVRRHESNFQTKFMIYDWDKISSNDYVGGASIDVADLIEAAPKPDPATGLYDPKEDGVHSMKEFVLPLSRLEKDEEVKYKGNKHAPTLVVEAKFTPYDALRQRFWRQLGLHYDTNDSGTLSQLELTSMLDSLGSTLTTQTIENFFRRHGKNPEEDELTFDEMITAIEEEIKKPWTQKRRAASVSLESGAQTPSLDGLGAFGQVGAEVNQGMDFSGPVAPSAGQQSSYFPPTQPGSVNEPMTKPIAGAVPHMRTPGNVNRDLSQLSISSTSSSSRSTSGSGTVSNILNAPSSATTPGLSGGEMPKQRTGSSSGSSPSITPLVTVDGSAVSEMDANSVERVIRLKSCPLCHKPRLSKKAEVDIVTHLAVCASQDWRRVDSMVVSNFVTASQAHRKWYTKVLNKVSQGNYSLGANSANIIVQDRLSGELMEEKMQVYVRLGIRLLYKGARSRMEGARVKKMLKNMSVKQGVKFDSPASAREIPPFIAFHNLDLEEVRDPMDSFRTFNEFFYRKLKPDARPNSEPDNPHRLVSGADCRMMAFESVQEATRIWIKGREFSVARLLGDATKTIDSVESYQNGGSVAIFRLAPQDYHRFHCPADATVGKFTWIDGQYYTVNPMAIRSAIDVYGENIRVVVPFHSKEFGTFYAVCIGAMMVGSTVLTIKPGDKIKRGQEFGYFKFGGSTIVLVFEKDRMVFDDDILDNSQAAIETLVRVGMGIGRAKE